MEEVFKVAKAETVALLCTAKWQETDAWHNGY